jgi:hypothetical protein
MTSLRTPALAGDFALVPVPEQLAWRQALARSIIDKMEMPDWKKQEQIEPMTLTIACLVEAGMTDPKKITQHILHKTT